MRMKLSPDARKMVICTTAGYIMVIHDLNLQTLPADLLGFKVSASQTMSTNSFFFDYLVVIKKKLDKFFLQRAAKYVQTDADK